MKRKIQDILKKYRATRSFAEDSFFDYTWISVYISILNIFLLWLLIDILGIHTVISSILVVGGTFVYRYFLYKGRKVL